MITGEQEYLDYLATIIRSYNPPNVLIRIPANEPIYNIDLSTRVIEGPKFLGVEADHDAEIIYFLMDRYYDNVDLSECIGVVQFKNAKNEEYMYIIPAYDVLSFPNQILFGWNIQSPVTKYGGNVQFSFKFFKMDKTSGELLYELNTLICKTKVLVGWASRTGTQHNYLTYPVEHIISENNIMNKIQEIYDANKKLAIYWIDAI